MLSAYSGERVPGAAVLVIRDGEKLLQQGYGMADIERGMPVDSSTNFRLASITKQFTATAIMMLAPAAALIRSARLRAAGTR